MYAAFIRTLAFALALFPALASAQLAGGLIFPGPGTPASSVIYQGPGDVVSGAIAFYSCRAYSAAKAGTKAYRIVRASDNTQTDINSLASGLCDTATPATFCTSTTCKIVTYYDQTGALACAGSTACDVTQATDANRPSWTASSLNGWPCATSGGTGIGLQSANTLTQAQPYSLSAIGERTGATTGSNPLIDVGVNVPLLGFNNSAGSARFSSGGTAITKAATESAFHALIGVSISGANSLLIVDGSASSATNMGTNSPASNVVFMNTTALSASPAGAGCEAGIWPSGFNSTQYGNLNTNMHSATNGWNF